MRGFGFEIVDRSELLQKLTLLATVIIKIK